MNNDCKYVGAKLETRGGMVTLITDYMNAVAGLRVELTRMTAKSGTIVYAVIVRHCGFRRRNRWVGGYRNIYKFTTLGKAFGYYKAAIGRA